MPHRENKKFLFDDDARNAILAGARITYRSVRGTFGPMSSNVAIQKNWGPARFTHDGVTVAREVQLENDEQNIGAEALAMASKKTMEVAGDGTSATVILGYHVVRLANMSVAAGRNPMLMKRGITRAALDAKDLVDTLKKPIEGKQLAQVATISASGNAAIGELIAEVVGKVGNGVTIEEYPGLNVEKELVDGFYIDKGNASPQLASIIDSEETNPVSVLVLEKHLTKPDTIHPLFRKLFTDFKRTKLLIVGSVSGAALDWIVECMRQTTWEVGIVDSPMYGQQRSEFLMDVCAATGAKLVPASAKELKVADLGKVRQVSLTSRSATLVEGGGDPELVMSRIEDIRTNLKTETNEVIRMQMESRLAKLQGRIGIIRVGGATEAELKETKDRVDDAVHAAQGAIEDGIVAGGATTLVKVSQQLLGRVESGQTGLELPDEVEGYRVAAEALKQPFVDLMRNSGQRPEYNLAMVEESAYGMGYHAERPTDAPIDLLEAGVVDPAKVIKYEVENGLSIAAELVVTETTISHVALANVEQIEGEDSE